MYSIEITETNSFNKNLNILKTLEKAQLLEEEGLGDKIATTKNLPLNFKFNKSLMDLITGDMLEPNLKAIDDELIEECNTTGLDVDISPLFYNYEQLLKKFVSIEQFYFNEFCISTYSLNDERMQPLTIHELYCKLVHYVLHEYHYIHVKKDDDNSYNVYFINNKTMYSVLLYNINTDHAIDWYLY
ncbi:hypothetical protein DY052_05820 [Apilactobacillus timberlakei]|uniref:hypothetical protein n=1 Tax=Apilactobacillus timberlakei TaxID=2008380 RepID=UPI00112C088A|nr:hypothetical protein [Apilactobacillus timberlakei]TPR14940.1 hypothetical protein DY052_05820 [Apilactobacillus timberlakei]